ncbi:MAG: hypothetical protein EBX61_08245, partial [Betaproteobacteria bacterium]|nr:hypothetical protein [Betaproteobacteria bacterium]
MSLRQAKCKSWRVGLKFKLAYPLKKVERCGINNVVSVKPVGLDEPARVGDFNRDRTSQRTGQIGFCARILLTSLFLTTTLTWAQPAQRTIENFRWVVTPARFGAQAEFDLPEQIDVQNSNNNVGITQFDGRLFVAWRTAP